MCSGRADRAFLCRIAVILFAVMLSSYAAAQSDSLAQSDAAVACVRFKVGNASLQSSFPGNAEALSTITSTFDRITADSLTILDSVVVYAYTSPEGSHQINRRLSKERTAEFVDFILEHSPGFDESKIRRKDQYIDRKTLEEYVKNSNYSNKDEILSIVNSEGRLVKFNDRGLTIDSRVLKLAHFNDGRLFKSLGWNIFPQMRRVCVEVYTTPPLSDTAVARRVELPEIFNVPEPLKVDSVKPEAVVAPVDTVVPADTVAPADTVPADTIPKRPFYMDLRTNMLFDVAMIINGGAEFYLGKNLSLGFNYNYAWWKRDKSTFYWRTYGGDVFFRWWFGKKAKEKPLTGHHIGIHGLAYTYDYEVGKGGGGIISNLGNIHFGGGFEYGYALPIHRILNLDFTIGVGYIGGKYDEYIPADGHYVWTRTMRRHWIGPTKAEVSLALLLGRGNVNQMKERKRKENIEAIDNSAQSATPADTATTATPVAE